MYSFQYTFKEARPVWGVNPVREYNQFFGFYTACAVRAGSKLKIAIAARSYYRLFVDGELLSCGPARSARHYCRVDELEVPAPEGNEGRKVKIAVETAALNKPDRYCNDNTLEPGLFACEITDENGEVLAATGRENDFSCAELLYRRSDVETMSHSRGIVEWYDLTEESYGWILGRGDWKKPEVLHEDVTFLVRHAPYASLRPIRMEHMTDISDMRQENGEAGFVLTITPKFNPRWYARIPEQNLFLKTLRGLKEVPFTGTFRAEQGKKVCLHPGKDGFSVTFENPASELGFIDFSVEVKTETLIDMINADHLSYEGELRANTYATRYHLMPGRYHLTTFEPKLVRYLRFVFHTEGEVILGWPQLLDDSYPESGLCSFSADDGDLNRIWEGAKRTLRLSTLDIFMDCPQRERGGWLCDSTFSAEAAWMLFGSTGTERDFLENFMLTENVWHDFFPEVYPGCKADETDPGFINWSYWLALEVCDYCERSGDAESIAAWRPRIERFVRGLLVLRGESGLIETERGEFVDWSLANRSFAVKPVSIPNNCLAVLALERLGELYSVPAWKNAAGEMRRIIEKMDAAPGIFGGGGDGAKMEDERLVRTDCPSEGGQALELLGGFHQNDRIYRERFIKTMGPCPEFRPNPNIARANLFIGIMIRWSVLAKMDETDVLVRELKNVYLEELKLGSGTFFENINAISGCHGFNGMAGAFLTEKVLGLARISEREKKIVLSPHPGNLRWARGSAACSAGPILLRWRADHAEHILRVTMNCPDGWQVVFRRLSALTGWRVILNGKEM